MEALPHAKAQIHAVAIYIGGRLHMKDWLPYEPCKTLPLCQEADETLNHIFFRCLISIVLCTR